MSWEEFRRHHDVLEASHRGLQRHLIPQWVRQPKAMHDRLESSAYGETPPALIESMLDAVGVEQEELFVDLGCGAGNVCAAALRRGARVLGIERNPVLAAAARLFLRQVRPTVLELRCADFLETDWSLANVAYTTNARYPRSICEGLAKKASEAPKLRAFACLGRALPLDESWTRKALGDHPVVWNAGEATLQEPLFLYRRRPT